MLFGKKDSIDEYVVFQLILFSSSIDLVAKNYIQFLTFQEAIEELVKQRSAKGGLDDFLAYLIQV